MADGRVLLFVRGFPYEGWKSIRITRSIETLAGSFALEVSDRWADGGVPWPIIEGDPCRVEVNGTVVIDGFIDKRSISSDATTRNLTYQGRDKAEDIVDCSVLVPDASTKGNKWTYRNVDIAAFTKAIAGQHGIKVSVQPGLKLKADPLLVAHPGETGYEAIKRAVGSSGVLVVSDGTGGILITQTSKERAQALVEGANLNTGSVDFDATERFYKYLVASQPPGTDDAYGESTRVQGEAIDADISRTNRVLMIRPEKGYDNAGAKRRADWEARIRAAKSAPVKAGVVGWFQSDGTLWPVNRITSVHAPRMLGVDGDLLISQVDFSASESGTTTELSLLRPDAFIPEPQTAIVQGEGAWKELAKGAK